MDSQVEVCSTARKGPETVGVRRWFDVVSAAEYCACKTKTIRAAYKAGKIPRARVGHKFVFDRRDLDNWLLGELIREN